jgi:Sporulation and spore germination/Lipoprotein LpqB beta-propeller domain
MSRRPVGIGLALLLGPVTLAGCADIPDSGSIERVGVEIESDNQLIHFAPRGPAPGASPTEIVTGFFEAMHAYPPTTEVAEQFLTSNAASAWDPSRATVVYENVGPTLSSRSTVRFRVVREAILDSRGAYHPLEGDSSYAEHQYMLKREHGEWRIANPVNAWYVDHEDFGRYYEPVSLYFADPSADALVPYPIYLPLGEQMATSLVQELLDGPPARNRKSLSSAPSLSVEGSVSIEDGIAEVNLSGQSLGMSVPERKLLCAQMVWTLWQVPGVEGVRILVDDARWEIPGVPAVQDLSLWNGYNNPATLPARDQMFALDAKGRLVQIVDRADPESDTRRRMRADVVSDSQWGATAQGIRSFDVGLTLGEVVAVTDDGSVLLGGKLYDSRSSEPTVLYERGFDLSEPVSTPGGEWLVVDRQPSASRLLVVRANGDVDRLRFGPLSDQRIRSLALSPDGTRFAAIAQPLRARGPEQTRIVQGELTFDAKGTSVTGVREIDELTVSGATVRHIWSVGWDDATTLAVLAGTSVGSPAAYAVRIDGSQLTNPWLLSTDIGAPQNLEVSSGSGDRVFVRNERGRLWYAVDRGWRLVDAGPLTAPAFAG